MKNVEISKIGYFVLWEAVVFMTMRAFLKGNWNSWLEITVFLIGGIVIALPIAAVVLYALVKLWDNYSWFRTGVKTACLLVGLLEVVALFYWRTEPTMQLLAYTVLLADAWVGWGFIWPTTPNPWAWAYKRIRE